VKEFDVVQESKQSGNQERVMFYQMEVLSRA
jgi:hypothetical protein